MAKVQRLISVVLRLAAAAAAAAAAVIMVTSHETTSFFGLEMEAKYSHIPSLIFFVVAFSVACAYSLLVLLLVWPGTTASRLVLMSDVIIGMVLTGAVAATGAIAEVGKNGNTHAGWLPICGQVQEYCSRVMGALIAGFVALVVYFLIIMYSLHEMAEPMCSCHY